MLTIVTVTKRNGWYLENAESLFNQTYKKFKWVIVYEPNVEPVEDAILDVKWVKAPKKKYHSNLNASLNEGMRHTDAGNVVFYQDFITLEPDTIEKFIKHAKRKSFITTATINPDGQHDARYTGTDTLREIPPHEWEANVALAPTKAIYDLGGFDEEYDKGWSWDNVNIAERAELLGYRFYIDESIKPKLTYHKKEPELDKTLELNFMRHEMTMRQIRIGQKPLKLNHL